jgi:hypothetical protein
MFPDLSNALIVQQKNWTFLMPGERNYAVSFIYTAYKVYKTLCPNDDTWKDKSQTQRQGTGYEADHFSCHPNLFIGAGR